MESVVTFQDTGWLCLKHQTGVPDGAGGLQIVESVPESSETSTADLPRSLELKLKTEEEEANGATAV